MKTYSPKPRDIERRWYVIDASGAVLGRLASEAAAILRGKHKPIYAPHMDTGDHVIVINAKDVQLTGAKLQTKVAYRHSGYPGGLTETRYDRLLAEKPAYAVEKAIKGMLPHNRLGRQMATKLKVYAGPTHRHAAQKPEPLALGEVPPWLGLPTPTPAAAQVASKAPEPTGPAPKRSTAKRPAAARRSTTAKPAAKGAAPAPSTTKRTTAKRTAAKPPEKAPAKKAPARRTKKESSE
jgi:large subunit ribosomal protein L13